MSHTHTFASFSSELKVILSRAIQMWRLVPTRSRWALIGAFLLMTAGGATSTWIPLLLGRMVDLVPAGGGDATSPELHRRLLFFLGLIAGAYAVREALQLFRRFLVEETTTRIEKHLFLKLVTHILQADMAVLTQERVGTLHGRILRTVGGSVRFLRAGFLDFFPVLIAGGIALTTAMTKNLNLGLLMAGIIPLSLGVTIRQLISQRNVRIDLMQLRDQLDGTLVEQLNGIEQIRAADTHAREIERLRRATENLRGKELRHHVVMSFYGSTKAMFEATFHVVVLGAAVLAAARGQISTGDVLMFSMLFLNVMAPLNEVHRVIDEGHESSLLVGELLKMLAEPPDRSYLAVEPEHDAVENREHAIKIDDLHVTHSTADQPRPTIAGLSLAIRHGEIVGIAGRSGCGKSTLVKTLLRLVHPTQGNALLDGVPLDAVSRKTIAELTSYVSQSPFIFSGTIEENIAYEQEDAAPEEIRRAAKAACLDDEILSMPDGYKAKVAERGKNLSGGQQQRLALARAFLKKTPILILDEATSTLDTISERQIQRTLSSMRGERTIIMVAHRLSTLQHADRIFVCDQGKIVETGSYHELVAQGGLFAELAKAPTFTSTTIDAAG